MFSLTVLKFPGVAGMGAGGKLKGSLGRGLLPKGLQTFILFKQKTILFTSLFKIRKLISWPWSISFKWPVFDTNFPANLPSGQLCR